MPGLRQLTTERRGVREAGRVRDQVEGSRPRRVRAPDHGPRHDRARPDARGLREPRGCVPPRGPPARVPRARRGGLPGRGDQVHRLDPDARGRPEPAGAARGRPGLLPLCGRAGHGPDPGPGVPPDGRASRAAPPRSVRRGRADREVRGDDRRALRALHRRLSRGDRVALRRSGRPQHSRPLPDRDALLPDRGGPRRVHGHDLLRPHPPRHGGARARHRERARLPARRRDDLGPLWAIRTDRVREPGLAPLHRSGHGRADQRMRSSRPTRSPMSGCSRSSAPLPTCPRST